VGLPLKRKISIQKERFGARLTFEVLKKIDDNAYKIDLPGEYAVSHIFSVADFKPYFGNDRLENLRENSF